jgi:hypothetical protein
MYPLLDTLLLFCSSTVICSGRSEGVKGLHSIQDLLFCSFTVNCSGGSEEPVSTPRYCYYVPPLLPVVEGV